jgi:hypothetical protein
MVLKDRSITSRRLYFAASNQGGRPPHASSAQAVRNLIDRLAPKNPRDPSSACGLACVTAFFAYAASIALSPRPSVEGRDHQRVRGPKSSAAREDLMWQVGPALQLQRDALLAYLTNQNDISDRRRWTAVGLLLGGLVVGFIGNVSLYL